MKAEVNDMNYSEIAQKYFSSIKNIDTRIMTSHVNAFLKYLKWDGIDLKDVDKDTLKQYIEYANNRYAVKGPILHQRIKHVYDFLQWCYENNYIKQNFKPMEGVIWRVNFAVLNEPLLLTFYEYFKDRVSNNLLNHMFKDATDFVFYLQKQGSDLANITQEDVSAFSESINSSLASYTARRRITNVKRFIAFLRDNGHLNNDFSGFELKVRRPRGIKNKAPVHVLSADYVKSELEQLRKDDRFISLYCYLCLIYYAGMRAIDISSLSAEMINWEDKTLTYKFNKKHITVPMKPELEEALLTYMRANNIKHGKLFNQVNRINVLASSIVPTLKPRILRRSGIVHNLPQHTMHRNLGMSPMIVEQYTNVQMMN
jgi:site-specific recombinase XerD